MYPINNYLNQIILMEKEQRPAFEIQLKTLHSASDSQDNKKVQEQQTPSDNQKPRLKSKWRHILIGLIISQSALMVGYSLKEITSIPMSLIMVEYHITFDIFLAQSILIGILPIGSILGTIAMRPLIKRYQRLTGIYIFTILSIIAIVLVNITTFYTFAAGRFLEGIGIGYYCAIAPVYLREIAPKEMRRMLGLFFSLGKIVGVLIAIALELIFQAVQLQIGWRIILSMTAFFSPLQALLIFLFGSPTPTEMLQKGEKDKAKQVIQRFYREEYVNQVFDEYHKELQMEQAKANEVNSEGQDLQKNITKNKRREYKDLKATLKHAEIELVAKEMTLEDLADLPDIREKRINLHENFESINKISQINQDTKRQRRNSVVDASLTPINQSRLSDLRDNREVQKSMAKGIFEKLNLQANRPQEEQSSSKPQDLSSKSNEQSVIQRKQTDQPLTFGQKKNYAYCLALHLCIIRNWSAGTAIISQGGLFIAPFNAQLGFYTSLIINSIQFIFVLIGLVYIQRIAGKRPLFLISIASMGIIDLALSIAMAFQNQVISLMLMCIFMVISGASFISPIWSYPSEIIPASQSLFPNILHWLSMSLATLVPPLVAGVMPNNNCYPIFIFFGLYCFFGFAHVFRYLRQSDGFTYNEIIKSFR